ncbi:MerR family transcriptional regulator [Cytobacillus sp. Hz8]|uniref:MerR family transcriptional regulator n=1 Tax=Cytobacillus sp. Hz8 TaxID=3347168 RepID=UPI0035DA2638
MKLSEVMKTTGLTRKAIYFYEEKGLIHPIKEKDNSYRIYSEGDINKLKQIKVLRHLDIPVKQIKEFLEDPKKFHKMMEKQLEVIRKKIHVLGETEIIIQALLMDNNHPKSLSKDLDKLNRYLDIDAQASNDYMKKELERIFPNGFGKMMAIMYGPFLDEPIDTREKEEAWNEFVKLLDSTDDVKIPEEITGILDKLYENSTKEGFEKFESRTGKIVNNILSFSGQISAEEMADIDKRIEEGKHQEGYSELLEMSKKLSEFLKANPNMLPADFSNYLGILSSKFNTFRNNMDMIFQNKYTIGKTFGGI